MMDQLSSLVLILAMTLLCVLPSHCELKSEESLEFNVMDDINDLSDAVRIKRKHQINDLQDDPLLKIRKPKQTQKSIKQKVDDFETAKRENNVMKPHSGDGKKLSLDALSGHQSRLKSGQTQMSKLIANKKSVVVRKAGNYPRKSVKQKRETENDGACVDDKRTVYEMEINHRLGKRAEGRKGKSGIKNKKSVKRDIKLNTLNEIKSVERKMKVGTADDLKKKIPKFPVNLSKNTENGVDDDDKACVDENWPLKGK